MSAFAVDNDFAHAVRAAGQGKPDSLVKFLLSFDREIGPGERQYLADLVSGKLRRGRGSGMQITAADRVFRRFAISEVRAAIRQGKSYKIAAETVAETLKINGETLEQWYRNPKRFGAELPRGFEADRDGVIQRIATANR